jgi:hypothetical protein
MGGMLGFYRKLDDEVKKPYRTSLAFFITILVVSSLLLIGEVTTNIFVSSRAGVVTANRSRYGIILYELRIQDAVTGRSSTGFYLSVFPKLYREGMVIEYKRGLLFSCIPSLFLNQILLPIVLDVMALGFLRIIFFRLRSMAVSIEKGESSKPPV